MSEKNLVSKEAVDKLRELAEAARTCMFATRLAEVPFQVCPMYLQQVDVQGCLWFFSGADSEHNAAVEADSRVQLIFSEPKDTKYVVVYGNASVETDRGKIDELWNQMVKAWFPDGKDDPNLTLLKVRPLKAHYWDTENGKMITMAKIMIASVTGTMEDGSVEGDLQV